MIYEEIKNTFMESAKSWICEGYSASIRYIAGIDNDSINIWEATIQLSPLEINVDNSFSIKLDKIILGQFDIHLSTEKELLELIGNAVKGFVETPVGKIILEKGNEYGYYSPSSNRNLWYYQLQLTVNGRSSKSADDRELVEIDNLLRLSDPPFDGLQDVISWLGLTGNRLSNQDPTLSITISPPVDIIFEECSISDDVFNLVLHAHAKLDTKLVNAAIRAVPGEYLKSRRQIAPTIKWDNEENNRLKGTASITVKNSDSLFFMLMIGNTTVRRQWFLDPNKARNNRFLAIQCFDNNLKMINNAVLDTPDSRKFEHGISALLFILGFSPCVQIETDSPDLIVQTPGGRLILVECTLRIADFSAKIGKLVDRRGALIKELDKSGHSTSISSALVCRLPRDQISAQTDDLVSHNIILISQEQLVEAFGRTRYHNDPDELLAKAESAINDNKQMLLKLDS